MAEPARRIDVQEARRLVASGEAKALDLRPEEEWQDSHLPGALHIPSAELGSRLEELSEHGRLVLVGPEATRAADTALGAALAVGESAATAVRPRRRTPRQRLVDARRQLVRGFRRTEQRGAGFRRRAVRTARRRMSALR
jgi:rhodanese-related sulfurtransferase